MFSSTSLLVLVCASAIVAQVADPAANKCTQAVIGNVIGIPVKLQSEPLNPPYLNFRVPIPNVPVCIFGVAGVYASVCDTDVPPEAVFQDFNTLYVYRKGAAQFTGSVTVTVICKLF